MATTTNARRLARSRVLRSASNVSKLTQVQRKALIDMLETDLDERAPTTAASKSDLLRMIQLLVMEFIAKYYPDATGAQVHISRYDGSTHRYTAVLPCPCPNGT